MPTACWIVKLVAALCGLASPVGLLGCHASSGPSIAAVLAANPDTFAAVTSKAVELRVEIVLSEVIEDSQGHPRLRRSSYRAGAEYFYPASAIKLCAAVAAVQKLEAIGAAVRGPDEPEDPIQDQRLLGSGGALTLQSTLSYCPIFGGESVRDHDPTNLKGGVITLGHEIRKLFLASDNESFNRLYEFVGHREINQRMQSLGLRSTVINHRLSVGRSADENRHTPRIDIAAAPGLVTVPERESQLIIRNATIPGLAVGTGFMAGDKLKPEPMDFTTRNGIAVTDLQDLLVMLARPDIDIGKGPLLLSPDHRRFVMDAMAEYPADSPNPKYERKDYPDDWGKFFLPGLMRVCPRGELRVVNKIGQAYGFTIDNAYIENTRTGRSFFLTAVIYTNADGILNDDTYEYESAAFPFMSSLAEAVARALWRPDSGG